MSKITAITQQKKHTDRYSIFVDGKYAIGVHGSLLLKHNIKVGDAFSLSLKRLLEEDDRLEKAYAGLLNFIAYRERCEYEVHEWLIKKKYIDIEDILITRLKDRDFLNNARFAHLFIRDRVKLKSWGPIRLRYALTAKRIEKATIEIELDRIKDDYDFDHLATDLALRKLQTKSAPTYKDKKRLWSYLQRRGYENSSIRAALSQIEFQNEIDGS